MRTRLLSLLLLLVAALVPSPAPNAAAAAPSLSLGSPHPSVPGMYFFGAAGWGRLTFTAQPPKLTTVLIATPWYSDATSRAKASWASTLLGYPITPHSSARVPDVVDGRQQICNYVHPHTGEVVLYEDGPCEHVNFWLRGPRNGFSYCVYKRCQTVGHGNQGGYSTFLAHSELWARIESTPQPPLVGFEPCGPACDDPGRDVTSTTSPPPPTSSTTSTPPTSPPSTPPVTPPDPCTVPGVDCTRPICDPSTGCAPRCGSAPCPPAPPCVVDSSCVPSGEYDDLRARIVLDVPDVFLARGTFGPQEVRVADVLLLCGDLPCAPGDERVVLPSLRTTGELELSPTTSGYRECATLAPSSCTFRRTSLDRGPSLEPGDLLRVVFFSPTRSDERLRIRVHDPEATVQVRANMPVHEWRRSGDGFELVATGVSAWQDAGRVTLPVDVVTTSGAPVPAAGLLRVVVGTTGQN